MHGLRGTAAGPCGSSSGRARPAAAARAARAVVPAAPRRRTPLRPLALHKGYAERGLDEQQPPPRPQLLTTPEDVVLECLTLARRGELAPLAAAGLLPERALAAPGAPVLVAGVEVNEAGPLARAAPLMDAAARRALPGHLLRRARILSSVRLGGSALLRVALTACTGEELLLNWRLGLVALPGLEGFTAEGAAEAPATAAAAEGEETAAAAAAGEEAAVAAAAAPPPPPLPPAGAEAEASDSTPPTSSSTGAGTATTATTTTSSSWQVLLVSRDASDDDDVHALPQAPHQRLPPERVILAQLRALQLRAASKPEHGEALLARASRFNMAGRSGASAGWDAHLRSFRALLAQPAWRLLGEHSSVELVSAALPTQRQLLQEVVLRGGKDGKEEAARFLWRLGMHGDGCWLVRAVERLR